MIYQWEKQLIAGVFIILHVKEKFDFNYLAILRLQLLMLPSSGTETAYYFAIWNNIAIQQPTSLVL